MTPNRSPKRIALFLFGLRAMAAAGQLPAAVTIRLDPGSQSESLLPVKWTVTIANNSSQAVLITAEDHYPPIELRIWNDAGVELTAWTRDRIAKQVSAADRKAVLVVMESRETVHFTVFVSHYADSEGKSRPLPPGRYRFQVRTAVVIDRRTMATAVVTSKVSAIVVRQDDPHKTAVPSSGDMDSKTVNKR